MGTQTVESWIGKVEKAVGCEEGYIGTNGHRMEDFLDWVVHHLLMTKIIRTLPSEKTYGTHIGC